MQKKQDAHETGVIIPAFRSPTAGPRWDFHGKRNENMSRLPASFFPGLRVGGRLYGGSVR